MNDIVKASPSAATIEKLRTNLSKYPEIDITVDVQNATRVNGYISVDVVCNHCKYTAPHNLQSLYKNKYTCLGCNVQKYKELCNAGNCEYLSHRSIRGRGASVLSKCLTCSTEIKSGLSDLIVGKKPHCESCFINHCDQLAKNIGCDYLGRCASTRQVILRCHKHNHEFSMSHIVMTRGQGCCTECRLNTYKCALYKRDCEFIKLKALKGSRTFAVYKNNQGEIFEAAVSNILRGEFATNNENQWRNKHSTYLIRTVFKGSTYYKIGTAVVPEQRLKKLKLIGDSEVFVLDSFSDRFGADKLESELHQEFKHLKLNRNVAEEFTTNVIKVKRKGVMEKVAIKDGSTEWYKSEVYDILKDRYKLE